MADKRLWNGCIAAVIAQLTAELTACWIWSASEIDDCGGGGGDDGDSTW